MKIIEIVKMKDPYNGVSKTTGKAYTIHEAWCRVKDNGQEFQASVKSYTADLIAEGKEYPAVAEEKSYEKDGETKRYKQYFVKSSGSGKSYGKQISKVTWEDFSKTAKACAVLADVLYSGEDKDYNAQTRWSYWSALFKSAWAVDATTIKAKYSQAEEKARMLEDQQKQAVINQYIEQQTKACRNIISVDETPELKKVIKNGIPDKPNEKIPF